MTPTLLAEHSGPFGRHQMRFAALNARCEWRVRTLATKEPSVYAWLQTLGPDDVLFDVGANIGVYTVFAAACMDARVVAFEPESQNFAALNLNLSLNDIGDRATAYCLAASNRIGLFPLHLSELSIGQSCHSLGDPVGPYLEPRSAAFVQGAVAAPLGMLVCGAGLPSPTHIKIDVDGFEHEVVWGLRGLIETVRE